MAKTKISISLIKESVPLDMVVKAGVPQLQLPNGQFLFYKSNQPVRPKWLDNFLGAAVVEEALLSKSVSAVILYQVDVGERVSRIFAICFGFGKSLLVSSVIERRFGLLVTLNSVGSDKLRSVDINSMEAVPLNNRIQSSALSSIGNFNIDVDKDLLKSVTGKTNDEEMNGTLSGADSLSVSTDKRYDEMDDFLRHCYALYKSNRYREAGFDWIDQIQAIKDTAKIEELNNRLIETLNSDEPVNVWTSIPEIVDYHSMGAFRLVSDTIYDDLSIDVIKSEFPNGFTLGNVKSRKVDYLNTDGSVMRSWSVYRCLYADFAENDHQYLLNDGKWYEVELDYVRSVQDFYNSVDLSKLPMPAYQWKDEADYNRHACEEHPDRYFLMDRKTIRLGGSPIEFCDIYTIDKQFVHVKKYSGSSVLSHLFLQGFVSASNFFDLSYRQKANEILQDPFKVSEGSISASDYEVIYVIAKKGIHDGERPEIPFFSKVSFKSIVSQLKRYGYKVSLQGINITYEEGGN